MNSYPLANAFWTMLWFFLLFRIILDIFRSKDLGGWGKAGWLIFVCILPFLGVFVYLIARGSKMTQRDVEDAQAADQAARSYIRDVAQESSPADQLAKLADLRERGVITDAEFRQSKAKVLQSTG